MIRIIGMSAVAMLIAIGEFASADIVLIDISPPASSALNSTNYANGDHTLGLSALNAVGQPASAATGNEVGSGITFDDVTKLLSWDIGYGSDFGFTDLLGGFAGAHIHGPEAVQFPGANISAPVAISLTTSHTGTTGTGRFTGSTVLSVIQEADLLNNLLYVNIHSDFAVGGEIRGQLVPVPEPSAYLLMCLVFSLVAMRRWGTQLGHLVATRPSE